MFTKDNRQDRLLLCPPLTLSWSCQRAMSCWFAAQHVSLPVCCLRLWPWAMLWLWAWCVTQVILTSHESSGGQVSGCSLCAVTQGHFPACGYTWETEYLHAHTRPCDDVFVDVLDECQVHCWNSSRSYNDARKEYFFYEIFFMDGWHPVIYTQNSLLHPKLFITLKRDKMKYEYDKLPLWTLWVKTVVFVLL